jgi:hypothetical protein
MVLDAKALSWAARNNIDTAKLKAARVPIYGKWYFPELPPDMALVNLETGEQQIFGERMVAGEVIYVPSEDLIRARLAPEDFKVLDVAILPPTERGMRTIAPEPLVAMARPAGYAADDTFAPILYPAAPAEEDAAAAAGIHLPSPSIAPFVLGLGFCLAMFGLITNLLIVIVGLLWMLAGSVVWIRVGLQESRAAAAHAVPGEGLEVEQG